MWILWMKTGMFMTVSLFITTMSPAQVLSVWTTGVSGPPLLGMPNLF